MQLLKKNVTTPYQKAFLVLTEKIILNHYMCIITAIMHHYMWSMCIIIIHITSLQLGFFFKA